ncbi:hypothetical protein Pcar_0424 [Syntrophotalea carbinolica DSM 2380]|uniref:Uncharacterized protein n=1 Tax=Syntrophotalea carbinolica (strain DSM 2380 / NBRC 103641 / GraBd1) TaxID=338963 RepID=Q3A7G0_SYNC1|nr:DsrE family protein [Syntrophotalea carbinolica]ABA87684.1 hypothetical protein Pcar_0424 [Syntrophotalea carbinolica DSM 2380]
MSKVALVGFNGETMCFVHVLLNALDMREKGLEVRVIIEGSSVRQIAELAEPAHPFAGLYAKVRDAGLIWAVCRACAVKMESLAAAEQQGLPIKGEMSGHVALADCLLDGYRIITF